MRKGIPYFVHVLKLYTLYLSLFVLLKKFKIRVRKVNGQNMIVFLTSNMPESVDQFSIEILVFLTFLLISSTVRFIAISSLIPIMR